MVRPMVYVQPFQTRDSCISVVLSTNGVHKLGHAPMTFQWEDHDLISIGLLEILLSYRSDDSCE